MCFQERAVQSDIAPTPNPVSPYATEVECAWGSDRALAYIDAFLAGDAPGWRACDDGLDQNRRWGHIRS